MPPPNPPARSIKAEAGVVEEMTATDIISAISAVNRATIGLEVKLRIFHLRELTRVGARRSPAQPRPAKPIPSAFSPLFVMPQKKLASN